MPGKDLAWSRLSNLEDVSVGWQPNFVQIQLTLSPSNREAIDLKPAEALLNKNIDEKKSFYTFQMQFFSKLMW
jgi:hypothetical protein